MQLRIVAVACNVRIGNTDEYLTMSLPAPARHHNVTQLMFRLGIGDSRDVEQGFLTSEGEFVRRRPALIIAEQAGQLIRPKEGGYQGPELFSEDLW